MKKNSLALLVFGAAKLKYIPGPFESDIQMLNLFSLQVTGTHVLVLEQDEFYSLEDLDTLYSDTLDHPEIDMFIIDFDEKIKNENFPPQRIYKWVV